MPIIMEHLLVLQQEKHSPLNKVMTILKTDEILPLGTYHLFQSQNTTQKGRQSVSFLRWLRHCGFARRSLVHFSQGFPQAVPSRFCRKSVVLLVFSTLQVGFSTDSTVFHIPTCGKLFTQVGKTSVIPSSF